VTVTYPCWLYSDTEPPQLVTGPVQQAALPGGFSVTPSANAMVLPAAVSLTADPIVTVLVKATPTSPPVQVKTPKHDHGKG
jgi:hypothetical protein